MLKSYGAINDDCEKKIWGFVYFAAIAAALNAVGIGLVLTYTSSSSSTMMDNSSSIQMTVDEISWIASVVQLSAIIGGCVSGYLSKKVGRKAVLMYNSAPFLGSWLIITYAPTVYCVYAGRFISGFCCGVITVSVPTYLVEISSPENRGLLGSFFNLGISFGVLISMTLGIVISWRWLATVGAIIVTVNVLLLYFAPESPPWLISKGYANEARRALKFLRGNNETVISDYNKIANSLTSNQSSFKFSDLIQPSLHKQILLAVALTFFQQFSGINPLMAYATEIFIEIGGLLSPTTSTLALAIVQTLTSCFGSFILDRIRRKVNFIISGLFISVGLAIIGIFALFSINDTSFNLNFGWMPVTGYIIFILAFSMGYGPLAFIITAEVTPLYARSAVMGIATVSMYLYSFIATKTFNDLQLILTESGAYFMYALISTCGVVFGIFCVPETKESSLDDFRRSLSKNNLLENKATSKGFNQP